MSTGPGALGPSDEARYGWPHAEAGELEAEATRVARLLVRSGGRVIGFLPVDAHLEPPERLAPLLARIAEALGGFVTGDVGVVDAWPTWPWGKAQEAGSMAAHRMRWIRPRVMEIAPTPCGDAGAAAVSLTNAVAGAPSSLASILVNLAGYANPGTVSQAVDVTDVLVLVLARRKTRRAAIDRVRAVLPTAKVLGAVLV
jgi:hypothetical protein